MALLNRAVKAWPVASQSAVSRAVQESTGSGRVGLTRGRFATYAQMYQQQPWVYIVMSKLARSVARLPLHAYSTNTAGDRERQRAGSLAALLAEPAPLITPFHVKESVVSNLCMYGNAILVKAGRNRENFNAPTELWPTNFSRWTVLPGLNHPIGGYVYKPEGDGKPIPFTPDEVIHFRWWSPNSDRVGMSPLEPLRRTLALEDAAQRASIAAYENGGRLAGVLTTPYAFDVTRDTDRLALKRLRDDVDRMYGGPDNAYKIAILEGGMDFKPTGSTVNDMDVVPMRKLTREEVAAAFDMPPPMVGILDNATFSNISEQRQMLYGDTLGAPIVMLQQTTNIQLVNPEPAWSGSFVEFVLEEVLRGNTLDRYRAYQLAQWWMTPNEIRRKDNMPKSDDPEADKLHVPTSTTVAQDQQENGAQGGAAGAKAALLDHLDHLQRQVESRMNAAQKLPNLQAFAHRADELAPGQVPPVWGALLSELPEAQNLDEARLLLRQMRSAILAD